MLGNGRITAFCFDGKERLCHIRGKLRKKVWINTGDIILVGLRDYQDDKVCDHFCLLNHTCAKGMLPKMFCAPIPAWHPFLRLDFEPHAALRRTCGTY